MNNKPLEGIEVFSWSQLHGKLLEIRVGLDSSDGIMTTIVLGYEKESGHSYVLHSQTGNTNERFFDK
jgi:hypothetical protein